MARFGRRARSSTRTGGKGRGEGHVDDRVAAGVGRDLGRARDRLALAVSARVGRQAGEELDQERGVGQAIERARRCAVTVPLEVTVVRTG